MFVYRLSSLLKIGVTIYSNIIILKLKYHSGYTYEYFSSFVLHLMTFCGLCFFVLVVYHEKLGNSCSLRESRVGRTCTCCLCPSSAHYWTFYPASVCEQLSIKELMFRIIFLLSTPQTSWAVLKYMVWNLFSWWTTGPDFKWDNLWINTLRMFLFFKIDA